jgi:hypothetical protein
MRKTRFVLLAATAAAGCSDHSIEIAKQLSQNAADAGAPLVFTIGRCDSRDSGPPVDRACTIDSGGRTYTEDGRLNVLPATPPYAAYIVFDPGYVPFREDITTDGAQPSIEAWACPSTVLGWPSCSAFDETNRIPSVASGTEEGGLLITIRNAVPEGSLVTIQLDFGALFRGRLSSSAANGHCDLPSASFCAGAGTTGYAFRFYVGTAPSGPEADGASPAPPPPDTGQAPGGACLLSYNTALASGDPCCYHQGGRNSCDQGVRCNDRSGAACCTIYASENTKNGQRCCRYEGGGSVDGADECNDLLGAGR